MATTIESNGSKWAGEQPDNINKLMDVLGSYVLSRIHAPFIETPKAGERWAAQGMTRFSGNFLELSHVFSIDTDEPEMIKRLTAAIEANMGRADYQAQPSRDEVMAARNAEADERWAKRQAERERAARRLLGLKG